MQISSCRLSCSPFVVLLGLSFGHLGALLGLSWALLGQSWGLLGHASDPLGLMFSSWLLLAAFLGQPLPVLASILVKCLITFWIVLWATFWTFFWKCCLKAFWDQKLPRRRQGEAQRRHKVAFLLLFTMVSACFVFGVLSGS